MPDPGFLADAFGLGHPTEFSEVARGAMGAVWRLDVAGSASSYAAKELFWNPPDEERVASEVDLVERCRASGVRSQRAVAATDGRYLVRAPDGDRWWRLYEWIDGRTPDRQDPATAEWLVRQLGLIHRADVPAAPAYQPHDAWYHRVGVDWDQLASEAGRCGVPWAGRLGGAVPRLEELSRLVNDAPVGPGVPSHRDLNGSNTVLDDAGRLWLVDWDNFGLLAPWRELGALLAEHLDDPARLRRLTATYLDTAKVVELPDGPELFVTGLAVWLNFLAGQARSVLGPDDDGDHKAWSIERVDGLIGPFPTLTELSDAAAVVMDVVTDTAPDRAAQGNVW